MQKIISFTVDDLAADAAGLAETLTDACNRRRTRYRIHGLCHIEEVLYFVLLPLPKDEPPADYIFVSTEDVTEAGMTSLLEARWEAGFDAVGAVALGEANYFILFAVPQDPR